MGANVTVSFAEVMFYIRTNRKTVLLHNLSFACLAFCGYGAASWVPAFFMRTYGMEASDVGFMYGLLVGVLGSAGIVCGGKLCDILAKKGYQDAPMRVALLAALIALPSYAGYLVVDINIAVIATGVGCFALAMPFGVAPAAIQEIMPNPMRGQASAMYLFVVTLVGLGVGPTAVALFTDYVFQDESAVRFSLAICCSTATLLAIVLLWSSLKPYRLSLQRLKDWQVATGSY